MTVNDWQNLRSASHLERPALIVSGSGVFSAGSAGSAGSAQLMLRWFASEAEEQCLAGLEQGSTASERDKDAVECPLWPHEVRAPVE